MFHETKEIKMFKKTLLALAVLGSANAMAAASVIETTAAAGVTKPQLISAQGAEGNTSVALGDLTVNIDADNLASYNTLTGFTITLTGATFTAGAAFDVEYVEAADGGGATGGADDVASLKVNGAVTYPTSSSAKILVSNAGDKAAIQGAKVADSFVIKGLTVKADSFNVGDKIKAVVSLDSAVPGVSVESMSADITQVINQYVITALTGNAVLGQTGGNALKVDVSKKRLSWNDGTNTPVSADEVIASVDAKVIDLLAADASSDTVKFTVNTSLGFLDADGKAGIDAGAVTTATGTPTILAGNAGVSESKAIAATYFDGVAAEPLTETFTFTVDGKTHVIPAQSATVDATFGYKTAANVAKVYTGSTSAGSWVLNGSSFTVPYMPFGPNTKAILNVTHTGSLDGELFVDYLLEDSSTWVALPLSGQIIKPGITNLKETVVDAIEAIHGKAGKVSLRVTINAPEDDISAFAGFKVANATGESRVAVGTYGQLGTKKNTD